MSAALLARVSSLEEESCSPLPATMSKPSAEWNAADRKRRVKAMDLCGERSFSRTEVEKIKERHQFHDRLDELRSKVKKTITDKKAKKDLELKAKFQQIRVQILQSQLKKIQQDAEDKAGPASSSDSKKLDMEGHAKEDPYWLAERSEEPCPDTF